MNFSVIQTLTWYLDYHNNKVFFLMKEFLSYSATPEYGEFSALWSGVPQSKKTIFLISLSLMKTDWMILAYASVYVSILILYYFSAIILSWKI